MTLCIEHVRSGFSQMTHIIWTWPVSPHFNSEESMYLITNILHNWHFLNSRQSANVCVCVCVGSYDCQIGTRCFSLVTQISVWCFTGSCGRDKSENLSNPPLSNLSSRQSCAVLCGNFSPVKTNSLRLFIYPAWSVIYTFIHYNPTNVCRSLQAANSPHMQLLNERAPRGSQCSGCLAGCFCFLSCCALWFALRSHPITGRVGQQQQQRRDCYGASMLCYHGYVKAAWCDAELTCRSLSMTWFIPFILFFRHISYMCMKLNPSYL